MRSTRWLAGMTVAALVPVTAGCFSAGGDGTASAARRCGLAIAVFGPLSGDSADHGRNIHDGALLAIEQHNKKDPDCPVDLVSMDSQGDPKQAPALAQQVVANPLIVGLIGPGFSGESQAADPLLTQGGVPMITASATEASLSQRGFTTFHRILGSDAAQGPAGGRYIRDVLKARKVFVIDDTGAYGHGLANEVSAVLGQRVVQSATVLPRQSDFARVVGLIRSAAPDAIFYGGYYSEAGALLRQVRQAGVRATFVAGDGVKDDGFLRGAGAAAAEGAIILCPCRPPEKAGDNFAARYQARFNRAASTYSAEAYDAATVFLRGIEAGNTSRARLESFVDRYSGPGITGPIKFTSSGELVDSSVSVWAYRVRDGAIVPDQSIPQA
jgi:branched-chain amino acid transport system substrate-binding protein